MLEIYPNFTRFFHPPSPVYSDLALLEFINSSNPQFIPINPRIRHRRVCTWCFLRGVYNSPSTLIISIYTHKTIILHVLCYTYIVKLCDKRKQLIKHLMQLILFVETYHCYIVLWYTQRAKISLVGEHVIVVLKQKLKD